MLEAFLVLFLVIILILMIGGTCVAAPKISKFTNTMYKDWDKQLESMKKNFGIGRPTGVLSYIPNQNNCNVKSNLLVQSNVAFKPTRHGSGCTYINMRYPG